VQNYLLMSHVAALRAILRRHAKDIPADAVGEMLGESHYQVCRTLTAALERHGVTAPAPALAPLTQANESWKVPGWPGWPLVQRRIRLLQADADKIIVHSEAIVRNVEASA
jgi:hypothetical protein